jgi:hypothetical protein
MTSFSSTSASAYSKSLQGNLNNLTSNTNLDLIRDIYRYQILNSFVINNLNNYINLFTKAKYTELKDSYTDAKRKNLSLILGNDSFFYNTNIDNLDGFNYDSGTFNNFRSSSKGLISGLEMAVKQFDQVNQLEKDVKYYENILSTEKNIIQYINEHKEVSQFAFDTTQVFNVKHVLKPWYERYLALYGPPNDGVFQNDLMADIVINLIREGVISEEDFITNTYEPPTF